MERDCNMLSLSFGKAASDLSEVVCFVCGEKGHGAGIHVQTEAGPVADEITRGETEASQDIVDENGQLLWQDDRNSDVDDSTPALYEPKESMQRETSAAFQTLDDTTVGSSK